MDRKWGGRIGFIFMALTILSVLVRLHMGEIWGVQLSSSFFLLPASYACLAIISSCYGYRIARFSIWCTLPCVVLFLLLQYISDVARAFSVDPKHIDLILRVDVQRLLIVLALSILVGQFSVAIGTSYLKRKMQGKCPLLRLACMSFVGMLLTITCYWLGTIDLAPDHLATIEQILKRWVILAGIILAYIPFIWLAFSMVREYDHANVFDEGVSLNPLDIFA